MHAPATINSAPANNNSYMDLTPGERLRITVPVLNSAPGLNPGGYRIATDSHETNDKTIMLSAPNLAGYEVSYYAIERHANGKVRLRFTSAEMTRNGTTTPEAVAPALPFPLPPKTQHVRLIYLVRSSQSDHNMAITASKNLDALNVFTSRLKGDPDFCKADSEVFCSWVPAGIAVRPEPSR